MQVQIQDIVEMKMSVYNNASHGNQNQIIYKLILPKSNLNKGWTLNNGM